VGISSIVEKATSPLVSMETLAKRLRAIQLRERGAKYRDIAREMSISVAYAHELVMAGMAELHDLVIESADQIRTLENNRLDAMWLDVELASAPTTKNGVEVAPRMSIGEAVALKIKIQERRAKLNGVDAPTELVGAGGGPILLAAVDAKEALKAKLDGLARQITATATAVETTADAPTSPSSTAS
jgi:hypothetical protein